MKSKYRCILNCYDCSPKNYLACVKETESMVKTKGDCCNVTLIRLKVGDRIQVGDYCYDARVLVERGKEVPQYPVKVTRTDEHSVISEGHHPHFRIVKTPILGRKKKV